MITFFIVLLVHSTILCSMITEILINYISIISIKVIGGIFIITFGILSSRLPVEQTRKFINYLI